MNLTVFFLASTVLSLLLIEAGLVWAAFIAMTGFVFYALFRAGRKSARTTRKIAGELGAGMWEGLEKTEGSYPKQKVWGHSLQEIGKKAGEQAFAPEYHKFAMKNWGKKISTAVKKLSESFKQLFEG